MPLNAGYSELINAYRQHQNVAGETKNKPSQKLLCFYAVECGLKHVYLRRNNLNTTKELPANLHSHDLALLAKELRIAADTIGNIPHFKLHRDKTNHSITLAHEAWRYGIDIEIDDESELLAWLQKMVEWIKGAI